MELLMPLYQEESSLAAFQGYDQAEAIILQLRKRHLEFQKEKKK